ncbi:MAG: co-chaperone GroES [Clostridia bacterium]|nr:co-chaperone GroES [Clostridia bacterium]
MNIKPLYDRVVLAAEDAKSKTASGIMLPEMAQEKSQVGTVVAVGTGIDLDGNKSEIQVKLGDKVLYSKFAGVEIKIEDKNYIVVRQTDILAILGGKN